MDTTNSDEFQTRLTSYKLELAEWVRQVHKPDKKWEELTECETVLFEVMVDLGGFTDADQWRCETGVKSAVFFTHLDGLLRKGYVEKVVDGDEEFYQMTDAWMVKRDLSGPHRKVTCGHIDTSGCV